MAVKQVQNGSDKLYTVKRWQNTVNMAWRSVYAEILTGKQGKRVYNIV